MIRVGRIERLEKYWEGMSKYDSMEVQKQPSVETMIEKERNLIVKRVGRLKRSLDKD